MKNRRKTFWKTAGLAAALSFSLLAGVYASEPIVLETQGSFAVGGSTITHEGTFTSENFLSTDGQKAYGDHAYVFYQIPVQAKTYPIVFQHGGAQSKRTWETTPDGRDGFQNLFLRKGFSVYLVDQPRSGEANLSTKPVPETDTWGHNPMYGDKTLYMLSRVGTYPDNEHPQLWPGSQFPEGEENYDQFQRSWNIESGALDNDVNADALAKLLDKTGPAIVMTHSMGGTIGWRLPFRTDKVKAIVALEPGGTPFLFPENEMPEEEKAVFAPLSATAQGVSAENFNRLAKVPMLLIYGDYIPERPSKDVGPDKWRTELDMARQFVSAINRHGGDATLIHLPDLGIHGNSHFLMQEKNNQEIADIIENWLKEKGLD
jgi:pimeloyl-ACP methyl ester carboxylesterase